MIQRSTNGKLQPDKPSTATASARPSDRKEIRRLLSEKARQAADANRWTLPRRASPPRLPIAVHRGRADVRGVFTARKIASGVQRNIITSLKTDRYCRQIARHNPFFRRKFARRGHIPINICRISTKALVFAYNKHLRQEKISARSIQ